MQTDLGNRLIDLLKGDVDYLLHVIQKHIEKDENQMWIEILVNGVYD